MLLRRLGFVLSPIFAAVFATMAAGCTPSIGDGCAISTNCSTSGDRLCDISQPGGYCTVFNCQGNRCPEESACVLFHPNVPGCDYNDRGGQRSGKSFCVKRCDSDSDCRPEYLCAVPQQRDAFILDDNQNQRVCVPAPRPPPGDGGVVVEDAGAPAPPLVCKAGSVVTPPEIDGSVPRPDAGADAGADAGTDASSDAGSSDAADGGG